MHNVSLIKTAQVKKITTLDVMFELIMEGMEVLDIFWNICHIKCRKTLQVWFSNLENVRSVMWHQSGLTIKIMAWMVFKHLASCFVTWKYCFFYSEKETSIVALTGEDLSSFFMLVMENHKTNIARLVTQEMAIYYLWSSFIN